MKQILLTVILFLFSITGFSQSACNTYNGNYNAILSAVKSKNTSEGQHKLDEGHLQSIAKYWEAVCKCESGVSSEAEASQLANTIFENKSYYADYFLDRGKKVMKDKTPFGDLYPTSKIYTKSSCLKGGQANTMESSMDCTPEAQTFISTAKDPQQFGKAFFRAYCECKNGVSSQERRNQLAAEMEINHKNYHAYRASAEPRINTQPLAASACPLVKISGSSAATPSFQQELTQYMNNLNSAVSLKREGVAMAQAFAREVKRFGDLGMASDPQSLLDNFNYNMSQISELQAQNRADNLSRLENTAVSALNDLNSGNTDGALMSAAAYLDQREAQKQAQREAEYQKQKLIQQHKEQMSQFYWKAVELNDQSIDAYYKNAAFTFSKNEEDYNLAYVAHHQCFADFMKSNFSYSNTYWTKNNCPKPQETFSLENNLVAKHTQYINTAKRKYEQYIRTGSPHFKDAAVRFAGSAIDELPTAEYFYLMGHYAGMDEPIVAFTAFESAREMNPSIFKDSERLTEYAMIKQHLSNLLKAAIVNNDIDFLKAATAAGVHKALTIDRDPALVYAVKLDNADAVQIFLNEYTKEQSQSKTRTLIRETIMLAATSNAEETLERFVEMDFTVDFKIKNKTPFEAAYQAQAKDAVLIIAVNSDKSGKYETQIIDEATKALDFNTLRKLQQRSKSQPHRARITTILNDFDEKTYADATQTNTKEAYQYYIAQFPLGNHLQEASDRVSKFVETEKYNAVVEAKSIEKTKEFLQDYPQGEYTYQAQLLLFDQLNEAGNAAYSEKSLRTARGYYTEAYEMKKLVQQNRKAELRTTKRRITNTTSYASVQFFSDNRASIGIGYVGLKAKGLGLSLTTQINATDYIYAVHIIDEDNVFKHSNGSTESLFELDREFNARSYMWIGGSIGATYKIVDPLWLSAGIGVGAYDQADLVSYKSEPNSPYVNEDYAYNTIEAGPLVYFETGVYVRLVKGLFFKGTYLMSSKMTAMQFGLAFTLAKY